MTRIINQAHRVAQTSASVLLTGETGVGKEAVARWIHKNSLRRDAPFVVVDPTTIPENLVESELFGHEKGAFTGAYRRKNGRLELAHSGTLFIDEIGEIPPGLQVKFLRVLQEKTFTRVGGTQPIRTDFRLLTATNRDLSEEVRKRNFREDLFYRINVLELDIAPLRERTEDIILLAGHFMEKYARRHNRPVPELTKEEQVKLCTYQWPGNVRELQNVIERSILLSSGAALELNLPAPPHRIESNPFADMPTMEDLQRRYIGFVLKKTNGRISGPRGAAELLGMKPTTLHSRMNRLGLSKR